jgi:hypothetical protein
VVECWREIKGGATLPLENSAEATAESESGEKPAPVKRRPDLRTAALVVAVRRVARATLRRGIWP